MVIPCNVYLVVVGVVQEWVSVWKARGWECSYHLGLSLLSADEVLELLPLLVLLLLGGNIYLIAVVMPEKKTSSRWLRHVLLQDAVQDIQAPMGKNPFLYTYFELLLDYRLPQEARNLPQFGASTWFCNNIYIIPITAL